MNKHKIVFIQKKQSIAKYTKVEQFAVTCIFFGIVHIFSKCMVFYKNEDK